MSTDWSRDAIFYHIYPLGALGAPAENGGTGPRTNRIERLTEWIPHLQALGMNAIYLGPLFESMSHGYDTVDYFEVDRRLGDMDALARTVGELHQAGIRVVLDGVFNHVGRNFPAFRDLALLRRRNDSLPLLHFCRRCPPSGQHASAVNAAGRGILAPIADNNGRRFEMPPRGALAQIVACSLLRMGEMERPAQCIRAPHRTGDEGGYSYGETAYRDHHRHFDARCRAPDNPPHPLLP